MRTPQTQTQPPPGSKDKSTRQQNQKNQGIPKDDEHLEWKLSKIEPNASTQVHNESMQATKQHEGEDSSNTDSTPTPGSQYKTLQQESDTNQTENTVSPVTITTERNQKRNINFQQERSQATEGTV